MTPTEHVCGVFDQVKRLGCCLCCAEPIYEVRETRDQPEHPLHGHPTRLGPMLEHGTQVTLLMSDGSEADVSFCLPCATHLTPATYQRAWLACVERGDLSAQVMRRSPNARVVAYARALAVWPMAVVRWRRVNEEGRAVLDRRRGMAHA